MIFTNLSQRPKRYYLEASDVADIINSSVTTGRIRQVARGYAGSGDPVGWLQFKAIIPDDGEFQFPFPNDHKYTPDDVQRVIEFIDNCRQQHKDLRYRVKTHRWYSDSDIPVLVGRCKKLKKKKADGEIMIPSASRRKKVAS